MGPLRFDIQDFLRLFQGIFARGAVKRFFFVVFLMIVGPTVLAMFDLGPQFFNGGRESLHAVAICCLWESAVLITSSLFVRERQFNFWYHQGPPVHWDGKDFAAQRRIKMALLYCGLGFAFVSVCSLFLSWLLTQPY